MAHPQPARRRNTFPRAFRLKRKRLIRPLFDRTRDDVGTVKAGCIRILFRFAKPEEVGIQTPLQVGFAMGRGIKRAVDRNRIKRHLRESFRTNQHDILDALAEHPLKTLTVMVIYRGVPDKASNQVPSHLPTALKELTKKIQEGSMPH